ncbi:hypothetical protein BKA93DRAFT_825445 [Sparassis latifolia]
MPVLAPSPIAPIEPDVFDDDDGWQDMPVVRNDEFASGLDEEDQRKYHYVAPERKERPSGGAGNATGNLLDVDYQGQEWRSKVDQNESEYTRLRVTEEDESDEVHLRTRYLFDEDKAMTPLSQMQATKDLLTEAQRVAYVGLCALTSREMSDSLKRVKRKELKKAIENMELWALKIMGRLYYHMELATEEQKMIETLALHGIQAKDLVPSLMTTRTVANPEYDPAEAQRQEEERAVSDAARLEELEGDSADLSETKTSSQAASADSSPEVPPPIPPKPVQTTAKVLEDTSSTVPGVSTHLSAADKNVTLDIRWTILCDLFLILIADSVYDARSRVLLENVALKLGLGWLDVVKFERRVTEALEIQEGVESLEQKEIIDGVKKTSKKRRYMMLGLATIGGGLVIGLSAGLLAPVIGAGLGAALTTVGITGTTGFLAGAGGAAVITTGGVLTGSGIAVRGMANRTQYVHTFDILPLHNTKRVNCILTVSGFMNGKLDDVRLPFSVLDPVVGDVFSVLWEPEMIQETGSALKILTSEVLTQLAQTALQATVMTALMSALQWPIILTKLGYLIDNPWSNALDRARAAGRVLADVLIHRHLGVRPITLIGFSLGSRVIFYALLELAKLKVFGIVQDVFLLGATVTAPLHTWLEVRSVISGRFVNAYARNDWVLNYLFRATSGGLNTVAGLRPVQDVPGLENVDVTDKIAGHMSYRTFMPLILDQLGFPVSADYFDEPVEPDFEGERIVVREDEDLKQKRSWFSKKKRPPTPTSRVSRPPSAGSFSSISPHKTLSPRSSVDDDLPPREAAPPPLIPPTAHGPETSSEPPVADGSDISASNIPVRAGFNFAAIKEVIGESERKPEEVQIPVPRRLPVPHIPEPAHRSESVPLPISESPESTPRIRASLNLPSMDDRDEPVAGPSSISNSDSMARSMSLNDVRSQETLASHDTEIPALNIEPSPASEAPSAVLYEASNSSFWPSEQPEQPPRYSSYSYRPTSSNLRLRETPSFGVSGRFGGPSTSYILPPPDDPFAQGTSLSFGGMDGSITFSPSSLNIEQARWAGSTLSSDNAKKSASVLDLNPWQS